MYVNIYKSEKTRARLLRTIVVTVWDHLGIYLLILPILCFDTYTDKVLDEHALAIPHRIVCDPKEFPWNLVDNRHRLD